MAKKDKLIIVEDAVIQGSYRIQWKLAEEDSVFGDMGATLGESYYTCMQPPQDSEEWEMWIAEKTCRDFGAEQDHIGYWWEKRSDASKVLKVINASFKQKKPIPEWAKEALLNGWKPPNGWHK